jgi:competence CoiA-like predicted nuclease
MLKSLTLNFSLAIIIFTGCKNKVNERNIDRLLLDAVFYEENCGSNMHKRFDGHNKIRLKKSFNSNNAKIRFYKTEELNVKTKFIIYESQTIYFCFPFNDEYGYDQYISSDQNVEKIIDSRITYQFPCISLEKSLNYIIRNDSINYPISLNTLDLKEKMLPYLFILFDSLNMGRVITKNNFNEILLNMQSSAKESKIEVTEIEEFNSFNKLNAESVYIYYYESVIKITPIKLDNKLIFGSKDDRLSNYCTVELLLPQLFYFYKG